MHEAGCAAREHRVAAMPVWHTFRMHGSGAMSVFEHPDYDGHEHIAFVNDPSAGLRAVLAIHRSGPMGVSGGGCRMWPYASSMEALSDVLRLSQAMSYKLALFDQPAGGAKLAILGDPRTDKTERLFRAVGRWIQALGGRFIVAEDAGTSPDDMRIIAKETHHVLGRSDDTAVATARGVFAGLRDAVRRRLDRDLAGVRVAVQGVGRVGARLARHLEEAGAQVTVADIDAERAERVARELGASVASPSEIVGLECDVLAPCALGGVLDETTVPTLRAKVVAGSANAQLAHPRVATELASRGVLFVPEFILNAGGVLGAAHEAGAGESGYGERIVAVLRAAFERAEREHVTPYEAAVAMAKERLEAMRPAAPA